MLTKKHSSFETLPASEKSRLLFSLIVEWRKDPASFFACMNDSFFAGLNWNTNLKASSQSQSTPFWAQFFFCSGKRNWGVSGVDMLDMWCKTRPIPSSLRLHGLDSSEVMLKEKPELLSWFDFSYLLDKSAPESVPWESLFTIAETLDRTCESSHMRYALAYSIMSVWFEKSSAFPPSVKEWVIHQSSMTGLRTLGASSAFVSTGLAEDIFDKHLLGKEEQVYEKANDLFFSVLEQRIKEGWDVPVLPVMMMFAKNKNSTASKAFLEKITLMNASRSWPWEKEVAMLRRM